MDNCVRSVNVNCVVKKAAALSRRQKTNDQEGNPKTYTGKHTGCSLLSLVPLFNSRFVSELRSLDSLRKYLPAVKLSYITLIYTSSNFPHHQIRQNCFTLSISTFPYSLFSLQHFHSKCTRTTPPSDLITSETFAAILKKAVNRPNNSILVLK